MKYTLEFYVSCAKWIFSISHTLPAKTQRFPLGLVWITVSTQIQPARQWRILLACCLREKPNWALHFHYPLRCSYGGAVCPEARAQRNRHAPLRCINIFCSCSAVLACCLPGNSRSRDGLFQWIFTWTSKTQPFSTPAENKAAWHREEINAMIIEGNQSW